MTDQPPTISYYNGKQLEQCSREELIECIKHLSRQAEAEAERHAQTLRLLESFRKVWTR